MLNAKWAIFLQPQKNLRPYYVIALSLPVCRQNDFCMITYVVVDIAFWIVGVHRGCDCIVVGFTTTYAIGAYHRLSCEFELHPLKGILYTTLCDKVCQRLITGGWLSPGTLVSNKTDCHDIIEMLLEVVLNTINQPTM